jgi:chromosome segregation ATPase
MHRFHAIVFATACAAALSCDRNSDVQEETRDLREAQSNVAREVTQIERDLGNAKAEVVRLEEKLALARQGITDDVLEERKELEQSLKSEQREVQGEINEARREAQALDQHVEQAARELERTQPPAHVESRVMTETEVTERPRTQVSTVERSEVIPVRGTTTTTVDAGASLPSGRSPTLLDTSR